MEDNFFAHACTYKQTTFHPIINRPYKRLTLYLMLDGALSINSRAAYSFCQIPPSLPSCSFYPRGTIYPFPLFSSSFRFLRPGTTLEEWDFLPLPPLNVFLSPSLLRYYRQICPTYSPISMQIVLNPTVATYRQVYFNGPSLSFRFLRPETTLEE